MLFYGRKALLHVNLRSNKLLVINISKLIRKNMDAPRRTSQKLEKEKSLNMPFLSQRNNLLNISYDEISSKAMEAFI